jgi:hypothetical protein
MHPIAATCCCLLPLFANKTNGVNAPAYTMSNEFCSQHIEALLFAQTPSVKRKAARSRKIHQARLTQLSQRNFNGRVVCQMPKRPGGVLFFSIAAVFQHADQKRQSSAFWRKKGVKTMVSGSLRRMGRNDRYVGKEAGTFDCEFVGRENSGISQGETRQMAVGCTLWCDKWLCLEMRG